MVSIVLASHGRFAEGIKESIDTIKGAEMTSAEANRLFEYTQWVDMMNAYAQRGASTVVLPSGFESAASVFEQVLAARQAPPAGGAKPDA